MFDGIFLLADRETKNKTEKNAIRGSKIRGSISFVLVVCNE